MSGGVEVAGIASDPWGTNGRTNGSDTNGFGTNASGDARNYDFGDSGSMNGDGGFGDGGDGDHGGNRGGCFNCGEEGHMKSECPNPRKPDGPCRHCGEEGHMNRDCPTRGPMVCHNCKEEGHMSKDCSTRGPLICRNCGEEGHTRSKCEKPRAIDRSGVLDVDPDVAWKKLEEAIRERDLDDVKAAIQMYAKSCPTMTYLELQEAIDTEGWKLYLIPLERELLPAYTNMDLQGNMGKKYSISFRFSDKPGRPREIEGWPKTKEEILSRLQDAGEVIDTGIPQCSNCKEMGHTKKHCKEEVQENMNRPAIMCFNCDTAGHRMRDCPEPRAVRGGCRNCGKPGHKASDCEEPRSADNVECRNCGEMGHFSKDCEKPRSNANMECRNCGEMGHMARECEKPRSAANVECRKCGQMGHFARDCQGEANNNDGASVASDKSPAGGDQDWNTNNDTGGGADGW